MTFLASCCAGESFSTWATKEHVILSFASEVEPEGWEEGEGRLSPLVPLRAELIAGDARCLYLGWLLCVQRGEFDDDEREPPVPPGLLLVGACPHSSCGSTFTSCTAE